MPSWFTSGVRHFSSPSRQFNFPETHQLVHIGYYINDGYNDGKAPYGATSAEEAKACEIGAYVYNTPWLVLEAIDRGIKGFPLQTQMLLFILPDFVKGHTMYTLDSVSPADGVQTVGESPFYWTGDAITTDFFRFTVSEGTHLKSATYIYDNGAIMEGSISGELPERFLENVPTVDRSSVPKELLERFESTP